MYSDILEQAVDHLVNHGGSNATLHFALASDIATDSVIGTVTLPEDNFILTTGPTMKSTKKAYTLDIVTTSGVLGSESIGEDEGHAHKITVNFRVKGNNPGALTLINSPNDRLVFWIPLNNGKTIQVGSKKLPAKVTTAYSGGETSGSGSFFNCTVEAFAAQVRFFNGVIPLTPAS